MKYLREIIKKWIIPQGYIELFKHKKKKDEVIFHENVTLKEKYKDIKRCFILATGPSIKTQNLESLKGEFCISVSNFFVHPLYNALKPYFHVFAASHPPITEEQYKAWLLDAENKTSFKTSFILSNTDRSIVEKNQLLLKNEVQYYEYGGTFPVDFTKKIPPVQTVVHIAIYLAIYLGIKEIILLGVDHDWLTHFGESRHFYHENEHKMVVKNYDEFSNSDFGDALESDARLWKYYKNIRVYAVNNNVKIYNACQTSLLDVFEKIDFNSIE